MKAHLERLRSRERDRSRERRRSRERLRDRRYPRDRLRDRRPRERDLNKIFKMKNYTCNNTNVLELYKNFVNTFETFDHFLGPFDASMLVLKYLYEY